MKEVTKLLHQYAAHGPLVIGVDFDDTIYNYSGTVEMAAQVKRSCELLEEAAMQGHILVLYTCRDEYDAQMLQWVDIIEKNYGLEFRLDSPVTSQSSKPYFNLLLDDKAGLPYAQDVLEQTLSIIREKYFLSLPKRD